MVRADLHAADFVLESLAFASDYQLFDAATSPGNEEMCPLFFFFCSVASDISLNALRERNPGKRLFLTTSAAVAVVDKAIALFPSVFTTQSAKRQSQVVAHFIKCASAAPGPGGAAAAAITLNSLCAVGRVLHSLIKARQPFGAGALQSTLLGWLRQCSVHSDSLVRRSAARVLGQLCRLEGGQMTATVLKQVLATLGQPGLPLEASAGAFQIIGALHKMTGAMQIASFQDVVTEVECDFFLFFSPPLLTQSLEQALLARLDIWSVHALWLVIEARGPGFAPLAGTALDAVYSLLLSPGTVLDPRMCILIGRVVNGIVSVLGLELQPGSRRFARFNSIHTELRAHPHALVQEESLHFQQMLILFAPRTVDVPSLVLLLRRELRSPYVSLRTAAVICVNQLLQLKADVILQQRLERELFYMLDNAVDVELNEQLQRLVGALVDALTLEAPSRLIRICKEIVEAKELRKPNEGPEAFSGPTGDEGKLKYADDEDGDEDVNTSRTEVLEEDEDNSHQTFMPSTLTKRFCLECVGRAVSTLKDRQEHFDLKLARETATSSPDGTTKDFLVFSLRELVNMASRAAGSTVHSLRRAGVLLMESIVSSFALTVDPDGEVGTEVPLLLKQYESSILTVISTCFRDAP